MGKIKRKKWSPEEDEQLETLWGTISKDRLVKKLDRSKNAINIRAYKLGLGPFLLGGDYITFNQLTLALGLGTVDGYKLTSWVKNRGFPIHNRQRDKVSIRVVYLNEFWMWAEKNRSVIDFSKVEENILGKEPDWVKEQRRMDYQQNRRIRQTPWTAIEDANLIRLLQENQYTYDTLSKKLHRSCGAIQRRILDLELKERPVKAGISPWSPEEYNQFARMIVEGHSYASMAEILVRSEKALRGRAFDVYHTEQLDKLADLIGNGEWGHNAPELTMQMMRRAREREKKERQDLMRRLWDALRKHRNDLGFDEFWQKDMCMNWDPLEGCLANAENCDMCGSSFVRIPAQYCVRCGCTFYERQKNRVCGPCRVARKKAAQRKFARTAANRSKAVDYYESEALA